MALLERLLGPSLQSLSNVIGGWGLGDVPGYLFGRSRISSSRQQVDAGTSLSLSAVFAGVRFLSEIIATLPLDVYRKLPTGGKECALSHPAYSLLATEPNPWMTAKTFRQMLEWNRLLGGRACAEIVWTGGGNVAELWPLEWWRVQEKKDDGLYYLIDGKRRVELDDMLHIPLVSQDGVRGCSFLEYAVESLGLGLSAQQCAALFFGNGSRPGGILTHKSSPDPKQRSEMRRTWEEVHSGPENKHKVAVMWGGWEYQADDGTMSPGESQLLESRKFSVEEVARWLNIPPTFLHDLTHSRFANMEEAGLNLVAYTLTPMLVGYEQEYDRKLLSPPSVYCKHSTNALMRGNSTARAEWFKSMCGIGVYSINDVCDIEDINPIGPMGDLRFIPVNLQPLEKAQWQAENPETPPKAGHANTEGGANDGTAASEGEPPDKPKPANSEPMRAMLEATYRRMLTKEANAAKRASGKPGEFLAWMDEFYPKHVDQLADAIAPAGADLPPSKAAELAQVAAQHWCDESRQQMLDASGTATAKTLPDAVEGLTDEWDKTRPAEAATAFIKELDDARN